MGRTIPKVREIEQDTLRGPRPAQYLTWDCIRNKPKKSNTKHKAYVPFTFEPGLL